MEVATGGHAAAIDVETAGVILGIRPLHVLPTGQMTSAGSPSRKVQAFEAAKGTWRLSQRIVTTSDMFGPFQGWCSTSRVS
jgi:hypothetical protein